MTVDSNTGTVESTDVARPQPIARERNRRRKVDDASTGIKAGPVWTLFAWILTLFFFAPVAWMVLTSFHQEADAAGKGRELRKGPRPFAIAHWVHGVHLLSLGRVQDAVASFQRAIIAAR